MRSQNSLNYRLSYRQFQPYRERWRVSLIVFVISINLGCSKTSDTPQGRNFSFIDHVKSAEIKAAPLVAPEYENLQINTYDKLWIKGKNGINFLPINFKKDFKKENENRIVEMSFSFSRKTKKFLRPAVIQKAFLGNFISLEVGRWKPVLGDWSLKNGTITNYSINSKLIQRDPNYNFGDSRLYVPHDLSLMIAQTQPFSDGQITGEFKFNTKPRKGYRFIKKKWNDRQIPSIN